MNTNKTVFALVLLSAALASGCASYRTETGAPLPINATTTSTKQIVISEDALPGRKYKEIGPVVGEVKKLTIFHKDPTKEQVNLVLTEKAKAMGADAIVNVTYKDGIGLMTWGYIEAKGTAVKFSD